LGNHITGENGNDVLTGGAWVDLLDGGQNNDTLNGGAGQDLLYGGSGDDSITGGADGAFIDGGDGTDTAFFSGNLASYTIQHPNATDYTIQGNGAAASDGFSTLNNVEFLHFADQTVAVSSLNFGTTIIGTDGDDTLTGGEGDDTINGLGGNDTINGGNGNDTITGGSGNDSIDGGSGNANTAVYSGNFASYTVHQNNDGSYTVTGPDGVDTVRNIQTLQFADQSVHPQDINQDQIIMGTAGDDTLVGATGNDQIFGLAGNDFLDGGSAGNDILDGGDNNDTLVAGSGLDVLKGGNGDDLLLATAFGSNAQIDGGDGNDTIRISQVGGGGQIDTAHFTGGTGTDFLHIEGNVFITGTLFSAASASIEQLQVDNGIIEGDDAADTLDFSGFTMVGTHGVFVEGELGNDTITGTSFNDTLVGGGFHVGSDGDDTLNGAGGDDQLSAGTGNDTLNGGDGNDTLTGGAGKSVMNGGNDNDTINASGGGIYVISGGDGNDTIEAFTATGLPSTGNAIDAGAGDDTVAIRNTTIAAASLLGGSGTDLLYVETSSNVTITGSSFSAAASGFEQFKSDFGAILTDNSGVNFDFSGFAMVGVNGVTINAGTGNNTLTGGSLGDRLTGNVGNDTLNGMAGNDNLFGGGGVNVLNGGDGNDTLTGGTGSDTLNGGNDNDTITATSGGSYTIDAGAGDDTVNIGNDNIDVIIATTALQGGTGSDTLHIAGAVELAGPSFSAASSGFEKLQNDSGIVGDNFADNFDFSGFTMVGSKGLVIAAQGGNDIIVGTALDDAISGGAGNDTLTGGAGSDVAVFSGVQANYSVVTNSGNQTVTVTDLRGGSPDGTDTLSQFEFIAFSDTTVQIGGTTNGAPMLGGGGGTVGYTEQAAGVAIASGLTVADDGANLAGATVAISAGFVTGDTLNFSNQNGISGSYNAGTHVLTLTGSSSLANYQAALRSVTFSSVSDDPTAGGSTSRTIGFSVSDGALSSGTANSTVTVTAVDDAPSVTGAGNTVGYTEQAAGVVVNGALSLSDPDNAALTGATVAISSGFIPGDTLNFANQNGISGSYDAGTHILTLSGTASLANYQAALRSVTFSSNSDDPTIFGNTSRTIGFSVGDGSLSSTAATSTVTVTAVDDAPSLTGAGNAAFYTEQAAGVVVSGTLSLADVDNTNLAGATVAISSGVVPGDTLNFTNQNGITGSYDAGTHILTLSGSASLANYQAALRSVTFSSNSDDPTIFGNVNRTIAFSVSDGTLASTVATSTVTVTAVNDAPTLGGAGNTALYTEQAAAIVLGGALALADPDNAALAGASVTISAGFVAGDTLNFTNQNGISGSYNAATHVLTLSGASSVANYQAALRSVTFASASDNPDAFGASPSRTITWKVDDGQAANHASNTATSTLTVTAVNDPASLHNDAFAANENFLGDGFNVLANNGFGADSDPDSVLQVTAVNGVAASIGHQITLASGALLTLNADGSFLYDSNHVFDALAAPGSGSADTSATDTFNYAVNGTVETATVTVTGVDSNDTLHGTAANDTFDGGSGSDTLVFTGNQADYTIHFDTTALAWIVQDNRAGAPDGTDTVRGVETFHFADGNFSAVAYAVPVNNGDGTSSSTVYDPANDRPFAYENFQFDTQHSIAQDTVVTDAGARWVANIDTTGTQSWTWMSSSFDPAGHQLTQLVVNDDGSRALTLFDAANAYRWTSATIAYDAAGNVTGVSGTNDDNSHTIAMKDVAPALDTAQWFSTLYDPNLGSTSGLTLTGGNNADVLYGHGNADVLNAGGGNDYLNGGAGDDTLIGGAGDDHFVFAPGDGKDIITDFTPGDGSGDVIDLSGFGFHSFADVQPLLQQLGPVAEIVFDHENHIELGNFAITQLNAGDFVFH
jgi:Ca2+-binding RTX toxin-like protein